MNHNCRKNWNPGRSARCMRGNVAPPNGRTLDMTQLSLAELIDKLHI
jgi:hypothetical protein